jgi:signal transduction histidine kinase
LKFQENFGNISIDLTVISSIPLRSDKMRLKIILNNLLSNAIKFQAPKKPNQFIRVSFKSTPEKYLIDVEDNGEGIKPEFKGKIFEMFFRGTQRSKGSGLGLYIALEAAEKIQGKITVSSEFGVGTLFHVELMKQQ